MFLLMGSWSCRGKLILVSIGLEDVNALVNDELTYLVENKFFFMETDRQENYLTCVCGKRYCS